MKIESIPDFSFLKEMNIEEIYPELEFEEKRKILEILIDKIIVYKGHGTKPVSERVEIKWNKFD